MELETLMKYFDKQIGVPKMMAPSPLLANMTVAANQEIFEARPNDQRLHYFVYLKDGSRLIESVWLTELKDLAPKVKNGSWPANYSNVPYLTLWP